MKKLTPYLVILVPLVIISIIQHTSCYRAWENSDFLSQSDTFDEYTVIYSMGLNKSQALNRYNLRLQVEKITENQQAVDFLQRYLKLAEQNSNSRFAGFAVSGYHLLPKNLQMNPDVLSVLADILNYVHDFDGALEILSQLQLTQNHSQQSTMKIMNIHMLKGNIELVAESCNKTKIFTDYRISIACKFWLQGMQTHNDKEVLNVLNKLKSISRYTDQRESVDLWIKQLVLDLQLKIDRVADAIFTIEKIYQSGKRDLSELIQLVDYLILTSRFELAGELLTEYDSANQMLVRRAILNRLDAVYEKALSHKEYFLIKEKVMDYVTIQETSKYRDAVLWLLLVEDEQNKAIQLATKNLYFYRTQNDYLLLEFARSNFRNNIVGRSL